MFVLDGFSSSPLLAADNWVTIWLVVAFAAFVAMLVFFAIVARYARLWIQSLTTGAGIGIFDLWRMTFRKVNPTVIVRSKIMAVQAGLDETEGLTTKALEAHYLAGGNVPLVIRSMIAARKAKIINLVYKQATAIDLAGRNILEAVQTSVYPRVIDCPARASKRPSLDAIAKDGIQLKVRARVTVRDGPASAGGRRRPNGRLCAWLGQCAWFGRLVPFELVGKTTTYRFPVSSSPARHFSL